MDILTTKEFKTFYQGSFKKTSQGALLAHYKVLTGSGKVGISVPKKLYKQAYKRNKLKRVIREWFKESKVENLEINIIITKSLILQDKALDELKTQLFQLLKQIKP